MRPTEPTVAAIVREQTGAAWSRARDLCTEGRVTVNGERCLDSALRVPPGAVVVVDERAAKLRPGALPESAIAYFDRDVVVVDKPAGMLSITYEPGDKDTLVDCTRALLRRMRGRGLDRGLGVVHRLDKDTTPSPRSKPRPRIRRRGEASPGRAVPRARHRARGTARPG